MRQFGKYLLVTGAGVCLLTLFVFMAANPESGAMDAGTSATTTYLVWGAIGAVTLILGAVFFAAGEVLRVLGPPAPQREPVPASRSHYD